MTTSAESAPGGADSREQTLIRMVQVMFPHSNFPQGPYERTAQAILVSARDDLRLDAQLAQGCVDLDAASGGRFADLDDVAALDLLRGFSDGDFFLGVRAQVITSLYDDREVWALLGYEGASFDQGGYLDRGFNDLEWLPDPRIEFVEED